MSLWMMGINAAAWVLIHLGISYTCAKWRRERFARERWLYRERNWERQGRLYERFGIRIWKRLAPDAGGWFREGVPKHALIRQETLYLRAFLAETRRAELVHWLSIPPALLFFLWNEAAVGFAMIGYALLFNLPLIVIQRYNRIRLQRILMRRKRW